MKSSKLFLLLVLIVGCTQDDLDDNIEGGNNTLQDLASVNTLQRDNVIACA